MYPDPVAQWAARRPTQVAVWTRLRTVTYAELDDMTARCAAATAAVSTPGDLVGVVAARSVDFVASLWGVARADRVPVPLDPDMTGGEYAGRTVQFRLAALTEPQQLVAGGETTDAVPPAAGSPYVVVFTSGSHGEPKGVILGWENIAAAAAASQRRLGTTADDGWLATLPLHHIGGMSILWRCGIAGATVVLESRFDAEVCADLLGEEATVASFVPTMLRRVLAASERRWKGVRAVLVGGAASDPDLIAAARRRGLPAVSTYGMTETASQVATESPQHADGETVGLPLDGVEVRINAGGRIEVAGPTVSPGYWGERLREGRWFTTGDLGEIGGDGRLRVVGRADDVIISGGLNVHPEVVEAVLSSHPRVLEAAVYGVPDAEWGELVVAAVVTDGGIDVEELAALARRQLRRHEIPRRWSLVYDLPHTASGKVDRSRLG